MLSLFRNRRSGEQSKSNRSGRPRYVSSIQRDIQNYNGWERSAVDSDYVASKKVHTILTLGYMEYVDDCLTLTDKGRMIMQNVGVKTVPAANRGQSG